MDPSALPESLDAVVAEPLACFRVEDLQGQSFGHIVGFSANNQHQGTDKEPGVLVASLWGGLLRGSNPVPMTFSVFPQSPAVIERLIISGPPSK